MFFFFSKEAERDLRLTVKYSPTFWANNEFWVLPVASEWLLVEFVII